MHELARKLSHPKDFGEPWQEIFAWKKSGIKNIRKKR